MDQENISYFCGWFVISTEKKGREIHGRGALKVPGTVPTTTRSEKLAGLERRSKKQTPDTRTGETSKRGVAPEHRPCSDYEAGMKARG
jgi:hypothetical protein